MSDVRYNQRGVSAGKEDVHNAIKNVDKGLFPQAFCKIVPDYLTGDDEHCNACRWCRYQKFISLYVLERNR
jgi:phosphoribosylformylglycinamidine cyclo-ligase